MTAQIGDKFLLKGEVYSLIGISGGDLASPQLYGMEPEMLHTACYRGFYASYELTDDTLYLREMTVREKNGHYRHIGDVEPNIGDGQATYLDLNEVVPFTGKIRLAKDFIRELYIHMGYQKASAFKTVMDYTLEKGRVKDIKDRSAEAEQIRGHFKKKFESDNVIKGINEAFNLDMDLK